MSPKPNNCINIPLSQTFRSYLHNRYGPGIYSKFRKFEPVKIPLAKTSSYVTIVMKFKLHDVVPKAPCQSHRSRKITLRASSPC
jgi:hypothetical protein